MNRRHLVSATLIASLLAAACGGSSATKGSPLVADPANDIPSSPDRDDADGGTAAAATSADAGGGAATASSSSALKGNEEGAQALLKQFVAEGANHASLTRSLRPTTADYKALFDATTAAKVEAAQAKDWDSGKAVIKPKATQTEIKVWSATGADIASGKGNAKEFPGGYKKVGKHLAPSVMFFRFKFVEAGKDTGTAYDGLAFVNGHWVIAPKPWKAIDGSKDDDDSAEETPAKPAKKPKKKKK